MSQQINLFNPAFQPQKRIFAARSMAQALALLLVGVIALGVYGNARVAAAQRDEQAAARLLAKKQAQLASVAAEFAPRKKSPATEAELALAEAQLDTLRKIAGVLERGELGDTRGYAEYFRALARQHVDGVWLTAVSVNGAGNDIGVRGRALDPALLPGYLGHLTREKALQGKAFGSLQIGRAAEGRAAEGRAAEGRAAQGQPAQGQPAQARGAEAAPYVEFSLQSGAEGAQP